MKGKATSRAALAISFLPHTKMQFDTADGTSDPSCQVQCLQQWPVPGVCGALPPGSTWPNARCWTERTNFSSGPAALTRCTIDTHKDKCFVQILGCCRSSLHLQIQDSPLGDFWAQHMHEVREFQRQKARGLKHSLQEGPRTAQDISLLHSLIIHSRRALHGE